MDIQDRPSYPAEGRRRTGRVAGRSRLGAGQAHAALRRGVLGQGHPRRHDPDARQGHRGRLHARAVLRRHAVQAGHRARRAAARQPRDRQRRAAGHLQADAGMVGPDVRLHVPRRQPRARVLRERPRRADEEAGRGPAEDQDPRADVLRHPPGGIEAEEEDQHAGRPGRHQAPDAAGRRMAAARPLDRRESRRRWPTPRPTPGCRPARSTARTIRCPTCRT